MNWEKDWETDTQARWTSGSLSIVATRGEKLTYTLWYGRTGSGRVADLIGTFDSPNEARDMANSLELS